MKIELHEIPIREVVEGYVNDDEEGVVGFKGKLNIRPKYQREFVYKDKQRDAVIETIRKDFPLNVMYWVKNTERIAKQLDISRITAKKYLLGLEKEGKVSSKKDGRAVYWWLNSSK